MKKVAVVYWSGTGNTQEMAKAIQEGIIAEGVACEFFEARAFKTTFVEQYSAIAFGCPSMGAEELEEDEFAPMFEACKPELAGKPVGLFGSYGWGDGEWMREWEKACAEAGINLIQEGIITQDQPDDEAKNNLLALGKALANY